ncbi:hypothetical protein RHS04_06754 [Rhizoctonia solani]|uniref:Uncharacterized protein n=1 Tax=Rhizoctonia solani TaxID=456999 RepID=A0A8H7LI81_9AGAM|nr:hypothetical protein RHS04_06754 [Rhizoctonia solani]
MPPRLDDNVVLKDPPKDEEDPTDNWNLPSLADPENNQNPNLPPPKEPKSDEDSSRKGEPTNQGQISPKKAKEMVKELQEFIDLSFHGHGKTCACSLGNVVLTQLQFMAGTLNLMVETEMKLIEASKTAAFAFKGEGKLPTNVYGTWNRTVMEDEDLSAAIQLWLQDQGKYVQAWDVIDFFGTEAAIQFKSIIDRRPSLCTAQQWMHWVGYTWMKEHQNLFADGHKQDDVKNYQTKYYVPKWTKLEQQMQSWDSEGTEILPELDEGERVAVSKKAGINKKGKGVLLMVANFISADYGWLQSRLDPPRATPTAPDESAAGEENLDNAWVIFCAGNQHDGWFGITHVVKQLLHAMLIVKKHYPNEDHVFIFNNATTHTKLPESAPNINRMMLGPLQKVGGEEVRASSEKVRIDYAPAILLDGTMQQLYHPLDHQNKKLQGAFKGMALILEEQGVPNA